MTTNRKLIKSTGIIGAAILSSRILGFIRDIIFAKLFGTNIFAQAFVVAYRLPSMMRDMVGEGATDAAIVPVLTEQSHKASKEEYWEIAHVILNLLLVALMVVTVIGVIFAPWLIRIIAPGFMKDPLKFDTAVSLSRMIFPYVIFLGMIAYSKGVLNSFHHFTAPAFAAVVLNVSIILSLLFLCPVYGINGMVAGILIGGLFQVLIQVPPLYSRGFRLEKRFNLVHPVARKVLKLLLPRVLGSAVYQMGVLIDTVLASFSWIVGAGGVAALYYANRLIQLPLSLFAIALATAALPKMSAEVARNDMEKLKGTLVFALDTVFMIMIPAAAGLMIMSGPIIRILFQRGEFSEYSTMITSSALFFYAAGLVAYSGIKILVNAFYSMGDTATPVRTASISLGINLLFNLILMWPLKVGGLALATAIAATCNFFMLYGKLNRRLGDIGTEAILGSLGRICGATFVMALVAFAGRTFLEIGPGGAVVKIIGLGLTLGLSGITYFAAAYIMKVDGIIRMTGMAVEKLKSMITAKEQ